MLKKWLFILLGSLSFALGTVGIFLPLLPTVPFYLLTGYLWVKSSPRLYQYFINSHYYKTYIQKVFIQKNVTNRSLIKMLCVLLVVLLIPFILIDSLIVRIILVIVFVSHLVVGYFYFKKKSS